jgi:hypothetical protein
VPGEGIAGARQFSHGDRIDVANEDHLDLLGDYTVALWFKANVASLRPLATLDRNSW